jgi:hypothetical protein
MAWWDESMAWLFDEQNDREQWSAALGAVKA